MKYTIYTLRTGKLKKCPEQEQGIFVSSQRSGPLWGPLTLPVNGCRGYLSGAKWPRRDVAHLCLEPRLTIGALTHQCPFPYASMAWAGTIVPLSYNKLVKVRSE